MGAIVKRKKISVVADANFAADIWATDPMSDKKFVFNWLFKIVEKMFGYYSHGNLLSLLGRGIDVKRETESGFFVIVKDEEFYVPKHKNVKDFPA